MDQSVNVSGDGNRVSAHNRPAARAGGPYRFTGYRPNPPADYAAKGTAAPPDEPQYEGVIFTDGTVALRWRTAFRSTSLWTSFEDFYLVHGHPEYGTRIEFHDTLDSITAARVRDAQDAGLR